MEVKNIIKKICSLINDDQLLLAIENNTFTDDQQKEINLLVECVNLTNVNIATNYSKLIETKTINNYSGVIKYSSLTNEAIYSIVCVKNENGRDLDFSLTTSGINTKKGTVSVKYSYFPKDVEYYDSIDNYPTKISERDFVYGAISEYLYAKGVFNEAQVWEERFKNEMQSKLRAQKNIRLRTSRWI